MNTHNRYEYTFNTDGRTLDPHQSGIGKALAIKHARMSKAGTPGLHVVIWRRRLGLLGLLGLPGTVRSWDEWKWVNIHNQLTKPYPSRRIIR